MFYFRVHSSVDNINIHMSHMCIQPRLFPIQRRFLCFFLLIVNGSTKTYRAAWPNGTYSIAFLRLSDLKDKWLDNLCSQPLHVFGPSCHVFWSLLCSVVVSRIGVFIADICKTFPVFQAVTVLMYRWFKVTILFSYNFYFLSPNF